jgi:hypothetical protein
MCGLPTWPPLQGRAPAARRAAANALPPNGWDAFDPIRAPGAHLVVLRGDLEHAGGAGRRGLLAGGVDRGAGPSERARQLDARVGGGGLGAGGGADRERAKGAGGLGGGGDLAAAGGCARPQGRVGPQAAGGSWQRVGGGVESPGHAGGAQEAPRVRCAGAAAPGAPLPGTHVGAGVAGGGEGAIAGHQVGDGGEAVAHRDQVGDGLGLAGLVDADLKGRGEGQGQGDRAGGRPRRVRRV